MQTRDFLPLSPFPRDPPTTPSRIRQPIRLQLGRAGGVDDLDRTITSRCILFVSSSHSSRSSPRDYVYENVNGWTSWYLNPRQLSQICICYKRGPRAALRA